MQTATGELAARQGKRRVVLNTDYSSCNEGGNSDGYDIPRLADVAAAGLFRRHPDGCLRDRSGAPASGTDAIRAATAATPVGSRWLLNGHGIGYGVSDGPGVCLAHPAALRLIG